MIPGRTVRPGLRRCKDSRAAEGGGAELLTPQVRLRVARGALAAGDRVAGAVEEWTAGVVEEWTAGAAETSGKAVSGPEVLRSRNPASDAGGRRNPSLTFGSEPRT